MNRIKDNDLIKFLSSENYEECNSAIKEILKRGVKMFRILIKQQGKTDICRGTLFGNPNSSSFTFTKISDLPLGSDEREKVITVEVACLYLISAIYYKRLNFAQNALLTDLNLSPKDRKAINKKEYIERGFKATKIWIEESEKVGIESLREKKHNPLGKANLAWW